MRAKACGWLSEFRLSPMSIGRVKEVCAEPTWILHCRPYLRTIKVASSFIDPRVFNMRSSILQGAASYRIKDGGATRKLWKGFVFFSDERPLGRITSAPLLPLNVTFWRVTWAQEERNNEKTSHSLYNSHVSRIGFMSVLCLFPFACHFIRRQQHA